MRHRNCPLCGCGLNEKIEKIKMILPKKYCLPESYNIVACSQCGFCYADTVATLENYNHYYEQCNVYSGMPVDVSDWKELHCIAGGLIANKLDKSAMLLDMGFGQGNFLCWLKENGYQNITGIDPSAISVKNMQQKGFRAIIGSVFELPQKGLLKQFDCVFLFDVLEHLLFPGEAIQNIKQYLKRNGYVLISVPNYNCLKYNHNPITNMFNQEHINYFSEVSLDNMMAGAGFIKIKTNADVKGEQEEIIAMYQMTEESKIFIEKDNTCKSEIEDYVRKFTAYRVNIEEKLSKIVKSDRKEVYVWGTGAFTMWLLANTILADFDITFIDNNEVKVGQSFWKGIIKAPKDIVREDVPIIICSMLYAEQIKQQIHNIGLSNDIIVV